MLRPPLLSGGEGSKILVTTRYERTCQIPEQIKRPKLTGLKVDDCWHLIQSLALPQDVNHHMKSVQIGNEIAKRCYGSPLAAKVLGALLNTRSAEEWPFVLSALQAPEDDPTGAALASLRISYHHLCYQLKQCFVYCSVFPNSYVFERDQLIRLWVAEGLIQPDGRCLPESVGMRYFNELLWRSFFAKVPISDKGKVERYTIPGLMHKLALQFSEYEFRAIQSGKILPGSKGGHQPLVRYASFTLSSDKNLNLECIDPYLNLRTLKIFNENSSLLPIYPTALSFFHKLKHLRALDTSNNDLEQVPDSVGELLHLRFLGLSYTKIRTLPEKICGLFNLQTLELKGCTRLALLPKGLGMLTNLRHLDLSLDWGLITDSTELVIPQGIGKLKNLQTLSRINVASAKDQHYNIFELMHLNLRGDLCMLNLEKVTTVHAKTANLKGKHFIEKLMLRWHSSALSDKVLQQQSEEVIHSIEPNNGLRCLWIVNYPGTLFPDWIGDASFWRLETIRISNCNNFNFISLLGKLPSLVDLQIDNVPMDTMSMPEGFPSLERLALLNLNSLKRLTLGNKMLKIKTLYVSDCSGLQDLDIHRDMYDKVEIRNCPSSLKIHCPLEGGMCK